jgi:hypothetical protein
MITQQILSFKCSQINYQTIAPTSSFLAQMMLAGHIAIFDYQIISFPR